MKSHRSTKEGKKGPGDRVSRADSEALREMDSNPCLDHLTPSLDRDMQWQQGRRHQHYQKGTKDPEHPSSGMGG